MTRDEAIARIAELEAEIRRLKIEHEIYSEKTRRAYDYRDRRAAGELLRRGPKPQTAPPDNVKAIIRAWEGGEKIASIAKRLSKSRQNVGWIINKWVTRGFASAEKHKAARRSAP